MITIFAPAGIGEVSAGADLTELILAAVAADDAGPLADGDVVVVTSKIISKAEGRTVRADDRQAAITAESLGTVARRGESRIVHTRGGLTMAAAGVDNSNVDPGTVLLLPVDPDASAARLRADLAGRTGLRLGVIISDTSGRAWRIGQTDLAIGAAGVRVIDSYAGRTDPYGNDLKVSAAAIADELAAAADLAKEKLTGRPVAVVRGLGRHVVEPGPDVPVARDLARPQGEDFFRLGAREATILAVLTAVGQADRYEAVLEHHDPESMIIDVISGAGLTGDQAELVRRILAVHADLGAVVPKLDQLVPTPTP
ncbi:coenzyme F420-0:L-glutamate ligase [Microlunatus parietis]|uniref:Coenzyme F420-0:L-glutamate ligase/coenzyme F420-1:gamma-L-glutamate ligase n=1 Tax=Microlunatus parietis TaxID=682979 RepID=A0A7Y9I5Q5_9ACTN|nr:coenzyme F420-0:L-glutamate ligase [Microlunatus parietis]NYE70758.1 coenzyme F420-0:L-glutamate ligase/coenzyme F420-1:gamma-L-glutamate ligase [Microlunatus parietis]